MMVILARSALFSPMWTRLPGRRPALRALRWLILPILNLIFPGMGVGALRSLHPVENVVPPLFLLVIERPDPLFLDHRRRLFEPRLGGLPVDVLEKSLDVVC